MSFINKIKLIPRKKLYQLLALALVIIITLNFLLKEEETTTEAISVKEVVSLTTAAKYSGSQSLSLIGNVRAFSEAKITSERSGRIVSVNAELGQQVQAGQVLATLENAAERASVLQAQGQYESALAAAAQSGVGVDEARNNLRQSQNGMVSTFKSTYNSVNGIVLNSIDDFFANPDASLPGLRIDGKGHTSKLNAERVNLQTLLAEWQAKANLINTESDLKTELDYAKANTQLVINMVDTFINIFNSQNSSGRYTDEELQGFSTTFTGLRSTLIGLTSQIDSSLTALQSAEESLKRSELASSGGVTSAADAQVKTALGSLRAAQANLAKTIYRTPISGTVNAIGVRKGDFINSFSQVAVVANNDALEIVTYISDSEQSILNEGDTVTIENKYEGVVTQIAPAVDSATKKIEVRIATEGQDIFNGDTVKITKEVESSVAENQATRVPLTAVKFEREDGFVFKVQDGQLLQIPVELGAVFGSSVEIISGITSTDEFVIDARGLVDGESVEVIE